MHMHRRQYVQTKTGQDLPKENLGEGLDDILGNYKTELGLTDKEGETLEHLQVRLHLRCAWHCAVPCVAQYFCVLGPTLCCAVLCSALWCARPGAVLWWGVVWYARPSAVPAVPQHAALCKTKHDVLTACKAVLRGRLQHCGLLAFFRTMQKPKRAGTPEAALTLYMSALCLPCQLSPD